MAKQAKQVEAVKDKKVLGPEIIIREYSCYSCGGKDYAVIGDLPRTDYCGTLPDGTAYTAVLRQAVKCKDCGQHGIVISHVKE